MTVKQIFLLGNPKLYEISQAVASNELGEMEKVVIDLHDTLMDFKKRFGAGRAIAAPQIGVMKRLIYMYINEPVVFINPDLDKKSKEMILVWDDCMCFPNLLVKVQRHQSCRVSYRDMQWGKHQMWLEDDLSELLQHEYDHLNGILAVSRATDERSFSLKSEAHRL